MKPKENRTRSYRCNDFSSHVSNAISAFFYRLGSTVASNPWKTIIICWLLVFTSAIGFLRFHSEKNPLKLWIPRDSKFLQDTEWLMHTFEEAPRVESVLLTANNVLQPKVLELLALINDEVTQFSVQLANSKPVKYNDVCFKVPIITGIVPAKRRRRNTDATSFFDDDIFSDKSEELDENESDHFDPSVHLNSDIFCGLVNSLPTGCYQHNILELWHLDRRRIAQLTKSDVLRTINKTIVSPVTGHKEDFSYRLGGVERNSSGVIVSATSILIEWMLAVNISEVDHEKIGNVAGTEDWASEQVLLWEAKFIETLQRLKNELEKEDIKIYYSAGRSYGDLSSAAMFQDMDKLMIGIALMFIYIQLVLSKFSWIEIRLMLGMIGLLTVGMAIIATGGICSLLGVSYGPVHTSLPFLLMGLGVDDLFVMMACWRKVATSPHTKDRSLTEKMGLMLQHAGASITVTSLTDIVAFLVGSTTVLPSLHSFCIYAAIGVFVTYLFAITFFVAVFTLDEHRIADRRNAFLICIRHDESAQQLCCEPNLMQTVLSALYRKFILTVPGKVIVIVTVASLTATASESLMRLEQKFDPQWFIPSRAYLHEFMTVRKEYYPEMGYDAGIYFGNIDYPVEMRKISELSDTVQNETEYLHKMSSWTTPFAEFVTRHYEKDSNNLTDADFHAYLSKFLFSPNGGKFQANFKFAHKLECGKSAPPIKGAMLEFKFRKFNVRSEYLPAKHRVEALVAATKLTTGDRFSTVWAKVFGNWITDEIIDEEVLRNICLALICVMGCTAVLIVNVQICFWIFICVLLTLINVCGFMQRWGLTIDLVSCIALQLAVGLCVDYAAHVGHTFLTISRGTRTERAMETILHIGAAVLFGGGSTILALAMLSGSEAYTFKAFFKIFFLVIVFGLFHGVVFFPVVLSLIGPAPYLRRGESMDKIAEPTEMISIVKTQIATVNDNNDLHLTNEMTKLNADNLD